jgi:Transposase DDE domain
MKQPSASMHVAKIERKHGGRTYVSYLLRQSYRADGKVKHRTLANLSHLPEPLIDLIRRSLQGETFLGSDKAVRTVASKPHGHVEAILTTCVKLDLENVLGSKPSRQRSLILALIVQRLLFPCSKLASLRYWHSTTLADELDVAEASSTELYKALDWLGKRQGLIEQKLAARHLEEGGVILYDVSSSFYEGRTCPLAHYGHDRDGKKGLPIIVYGLLTDPCGRPVAVDVYPGNTADSKTIPNQIVKVREKFALTRVILVGDRGMLTQTQIDTLRQYPGLGWISALRSEAIGQLLEEGILCAKLFAPVPLAEIASPDFPGERLIACYNAALAKERSEKRQRLLAATEVNLTRLAAEVQRRTKKPLRTAEIGVKAGKLIGRHKMAKHFQLQIADGLFSWQRDDASIEREEKLDGIYVIRTSEPAANLGAADCVRTYKSLSLVERAFRCLKGLDVLVRPIRHRVEPRVRAHVLLCMLAYYVEWHMRKALKPLLYEDEELEQSRRERDPVKPAQPSESAVAKKKTHQTADGFVAQDFRSLLAHLGARSRITYEVLAPTAQATFHQLSEPDALQAEALRLLQL